MLLSLSTFGATASYAASPKVALSGQCSYLQELNEGDTCNIVVSSSPTYKSRKFQVQTKFGTYGLWQNAGTWKLNSRGALSLGIADDCTKSTNFCSGDYFYRVVILKSGSKPKMVTNTIRLSIIETPAPSEPDEPVSLPSVPSSYSSKQGIVAALEAYCDFPSPSSLKASSWKGGGYWSGAAHLTAFTSKGMVYLKIANVGSGRLKVSADDDYDLEATNYFLDASGCSNNMILEVY